jgi:hypothetical protein
MTNQLGTWSDKLKFGSEMSNISRLAVIPQFCPTYKVQVIHIWLFRLVEFQCCLTWQDLSQASSLIRYQVWSNYQRHINQHGSSSYNH